MNMERASSTDGLSQHEKDVYYFMRDEIDNHDSPVDSKIQDPQFTAIVSREFNISAEEARNIYADVKEKLADLYWREKVQE